MIKPFGLTGYFLLVLVFAAGPSLAQTNPLDLQKVQSQADHLEDQAAQAIDNGDMVQGLGLMAQAVKLDPTPARRMNYGGMLYGDGIEIYKNIDEAQGLTILKQAQDQLLAAITAFNPNKDQVYLSQCYFLLGEISMDALGDTAKAKNYFKQASALSGFNGAKDALNKMGTAASN